MLSLFRNIYWCSPFDRDHLYDVTRSVLFESPGKTAGDGAEIHFFRTGLVHEKLSSSTDESKAQNVKIDPRFQSVWGQVGINLIRDLAVFARSVISHL